MVRVVLGCTLGILGAAALARGLHGFLFGIATLDPATFAAAPALLAATAAIAAALASLHAARLDPAQALRR
jgi:ABC-type antimicrobial peptide transport system permease subunit